MAHAEFGTTFDGMAKKLPDLERMLSRIHAKTCKKQELYVRSSLVELPSLARSKLTPSDSAQSYSLKVIAVRLPLLLFVFRHCASLTPTSSTPSSPSTASPQPSARSRRTPRISNRPPCPDCCATCPSLRPAWTRSRSFSRGMVSAVVPCTGGVGGADVFVGCAELLPVDGKDEDYEVRSQHLVLGG